MWQYDVQELKAKAATALEDRLDFFSEPWTTVVLAEMVHEHCPQDDMGLRNLLLNRLQASLLRILTHEKARADLLANDDMLMLLLGQLASIVENGVLQVPDRATALVTPPSSPTQTRSSGRPRKSLRLRN
jgi:hypothetical protein